MKLFSALIAATLWMISVSSHAAESVKPAGLVPQNVTVTNAAKLVTEKKVVVLDVRTAEEFKAGHIPGAKNIDFNGEDFAKQLAELDRHQPYLVHCAAGGRSGRSMETFKKLNFESIYHLDAGFNGWQKAGQPVEK